MRKRVANVQVVKDFMNSVCDEAKAEFSSADDVIKRFDFLYETREAQIERIAESNRKMESLQKVLRDSSIVRFFNTPLFLLYNFTFLKPIKLTSTL